MSTKLYSAYAVWFRRAVVFSASGSFAQDEQTGETLPLEEKGGVYMLKLWVKAHGFSGQARLRL